MVATGIIANLFSFEDHNFWKTLGLVGMLCPFIFAHHAWVRADAANKNFTKRSHSPQPPVELPEINLGEDEITERIGISISKRGDVGMNATPDRQERLEIIRRIAIAMAEKNGDPILADVEVLTQKTLDGNPKSEEDLDSRNPVATQADGGRYFPWVREDGRGQLDIKWPSGIEKTFKFWIPEKYLSEGTGSGGMAECPDAPTECPRSPRDNSLKRERRALPEIELVTTKPRWRDLWQHLLLIIIVGLAFVEWSHYGFYILLRFACCAGFARWCWISYQEKQEVWSWIWGLSAAVYNPFLPLSLGRSVWELVNAATILIIIVYAVRTSKGLTTPKELAQNILTWCFMLYLPVYFIAEAIYDNTPERKAEIAREKAEEEERLKKKKEKEYEKILPKFDSYTPNIPPFRFDE
ncbi:hypothetical protein OAF99_02350 [Akkermansiaceae bacterium]|nr:hypothetical protein [Akkermansiaceae bacterium]